MLNIEAFKAPKNNWKGENPIFLFELLYDNSDPAVPAYLRLAKYDKDVLFEGTTWLHFSSMGGIEVTENLQAESGAFDLALTNGGRIIGAIIEQFDLAGMVGRFVWVFPSTLDDPTAKKEASFEVVGARADLNVAILTVSPLAIDLTGTTLPTGTASLEEFPGMVGFRGRFIV